MAASSPNKVDILHPCAELKWRECRRLPVDTTNAQAVWLGDKLYVGEGWTSGSEGYEARLYIHTPTTDTWSRIDTPVFWFSLTTYHSQLVLVGGWELVGNRPVTNKLWTLTEHDQWKETLPPMTTKRYRTSAVEYADNILVAGGVDNEGRNVGIIEVYNGHYWVEAQSLPEPCYDMKSAVLNGHWYLMGGAGQGKEVYYASLDSLVANCRPSERYLLSIWKRLPNIPDIRSSTAVFGNRLIAVGGGGYPPISFIHAYSPHTKSWVHVGNIPVGLGSTCTAVLPTGDLMVIGGWRDTSMESCVHRANLKFNVVFTDGHFAMETLSQLEQIGIRPLRELEPYKGQFLSVVGMNKVDLPIDNSSSLLETWVQGRASLRPTWRHFFWALREIKLNHLADQIEASLTGVAVEQAAISEETEESEEDNKQEQETVITAEEEKHIAAVQKAMEERGMLDHTIVHGVFVGPARSGKNSLMERLLGRKPSSESPSTGVAESVVQVKVVQKSTTFAANVIESIWSIMDYDDEAIKLMLINSDSQDRITIQIPNLQREDSLDNRSTSEPLTCIGDDKTTDSDSNDEWFDALSSLPLHDSDGDWFDDLSSLLLHKTHQNLPLHDVAPSTDSSLDYTQVESRIESATTTTVVQSPPNRTHCQLPDSYVPPIDIIKVALRKKGKTGIEVLQQHFQKTWSLYLTNTGGQMEFQEVLPLLVSGPSMFFFTFRLDRDLNERYKIEYDLSDGTKAEPYISTLTTVEGLLQTLATIAAMGTFVYERLQRRKVPLKPKVFIVGTHRDKLEEATADTRISIIDQQLQEAIKSTAHYKDLVEFASPTQLMFAVSNFSESESDFKLIRLAVERVVRRNDFTMTSPVHWLIFSLALRKLKYFVITYDLCLEVARQCGLADDEVDEALYFIHSKMGLIRYFPYEDVKDLVVIDPQFLFDKVTELIIDTFTFEKTTKQTMDDFKQKGIFSLSEFETISSKTNTSIKPYKFAKLLESLRIAAPFQMDGERKYFFPCILVHAAETAIQQLMVIATPIPQLIVTFECGYCPKGLAGALIKYLMANEMESCYTWEIYTDKIFRNHVSFHVGPLDTIVLRITPTYLEIVCIPGKFPNRDKQCPLSKVCSEVRNAVEAGIKQVTSDINYVNAQHCLTFRCECKGDHPASLKYLGTQPYILYCSKTDERYPLSPEHELWQVKKPQPHHDPMPPPQTCTEEQMPLPKSVCTEADRHAILFNQVEKHSYFTGLTQYHQGSLVGQLSQHATKWRDIGTHLGFLPGELSNIEASPNLVQGAPVSWLRDMLAQWLQRTSSATLEDLKTALGKAGLAAAAHDLKL